MAPSVQPKPQIGSVTATASSNAAALSLLNNVRKDRFREGPNNANPYTKHVMGDAHQPWCAAFVSTKLEEANIPGISKKMFSASTAVLASQFQKDGLYIPRGQKQPQPGDVIFFGGRGSEHHTGFVQRVENGKVYTIEGNSSDMVSERVYSLDDPGIGGYGRVFPEGSVSADLGLEINATKGRAGGDPSRRAQGAGSSGRASSETGIDPWSYSRFTRALLLALIEAMLNGDVAGIQQALEQLFPYASVEDLAALAKTLKENPDLAAKFASNPELLKQLAANPETLQQLLRAPRDNSPADAATQELVRDLLNSTNFKDRPRALAALVPVLRQNDAAKGNGWGPAGQASGPEKPWQP